MKTLYLTTLLTCLLATSQISAQTASELTPPTFQPENQRLSGPVKISAPSVVEAPAGADKLFVALADVALEGALPEMAAVNAELKKYLVGGTIAVSDIFRAAGELETAYVRAGFVLVRVVLPPQTLVNGGTLRIIIVNGFVESVDASAVPTPVRERLERLTLPIVGRPDIKLRDIERQLLLAGDTYGVALGSALSAGADPGGTVVVLDPSYRSVTGFFGIDNLVADDLGPGVLSGGIELNSLLQLGETFYGRAIGAPDQFFSDFPQYRSLAIGAVVPIGFNGLTLNIEAVSSKTTPDDPIVPTTSSFDRISTRLFYPWVRSGNFNFSSQVSLDVQSDDQSLIGAGGLTPIYQDDLTVLRLSADAFWQNEAGSIFEGGVIFSQGLDALGARNIPPPGSVPLSRQGAGPVFSKLLLSARFRAALSERISLSVSGRFQSSFGDPLLNSEQFGIAGPRELSAFDAGELQGDGGWVVRGELSSPWQIQLAGTPQLLSPYIFGAVGAVNLEQPTVFEQPTVQATSFGIGVDLLTLEKSAFKSASLRLEYGRGERDDNRPDNNRFSIVGSYRF